MFAFSRCSGRSQLKIATPVSRTLDNPLDSRGKGCILKLERTHLVLSG